MDNKYTTHHPGGYTNKLFESTRYRVECVLTRRGKPQHAALTQYNEPTIRTYTYIIRGELCAQFLAEFKALKTEHAPYKSQQEWRWNNSVWHPFLAEWVAKMAAVKLALDTMEVTRAGNDPSGRANTLL